MILDDSIAAISPHIVDMNNKIYYSGVSVDTKKCQLNDFNLDNKSNIKKNVDIFHGCAVLLNTEKFIQAGMFEEKIFMYYDEAFLSKSFKALSYKIMYDPSVVIRHYGSYSLGNVSFTKSYYHTRNHILYFESYLQKRLFFCKYKVPFRNLLSAIRHFQCKRFFGILYGVLHATIKRTGML